MDACLDCSGKQKKTNSPAPLFRISTLFIRMADVAGKAMRCVDQLFIQRTFRIAGKVRAFQFRKFPPIQKDSFTGRTLVDFNFSNKPNFHFSATCWTFELSSRPVMERAFLSGGTIPDGMHSVRSFRPVSRAGVHGFFERYARKDFLNQVFPHT